MKTYYVDFYGWCEIEAEDSYDAKQKFWDLVAVQDKPLPHNLYEIDKVEEKEDF